MNGVSIVIPMYGVEKYIKECLECVANQTYQNIECIVVDDCGPDNSYEIAKEYLDNYEGNVVFKLIRHPYNKGLSGARNTGIENSTGEFIFFLDSDDLIATNAIEVLHANCHNVDIVMANMLIFSDETGVIIRNPQQTSKDYYYFNSLYEFMTNPEMVNLNNFGLPWNKLYRKSFIDEHSLRFFEGVLFEDDVWSFEMYSHGPKVAVISDIIYKYRSRNDGIMNTYNEYHLLSSLKAPNIVIQYVKKESIKEKWYAEQGIENFILSALFSSIDRTDDSSLFIKLYNHFTKTHKPSPSFWIDSRIKLATKVKSIHYYLPIIGKYYLKAILSIQKKKMLRLYPSRAKLPKVELSKHFWDKLNCFLKEYDQKVLT